MRKIYYTLCSSRTSFLFLNIILYYICLQIFELEKDLAEALRAAGLPPVIPRDKQEVVYAAEQIESHRRPKEIKPVQSDQISEISEDDIDAVSSPEYSPDREEAITTSVTLATSPVVNGHGSADKFVEDLSAVPETQLLDISASKDKAQLANSGALASRRKPTKPRSGSVVSEHVCLEDAVICLPAILCQLTVLDIHVVNFVYWYDCLRMCFDFLHFPPRIPNQMMKKTTHFSNMIGNHIYNTTTATGFTRTVQALLIATLISCT